MTHTLRGSILRFLGNSIFVVLVYQALVMNSASAENARRVAAVNDLAAQGVEASSALIISDRLRNEVARTGAFTMVEREQMQAILKEQGFQQSGVCTNEACLVEMGQLLGVDYMITGSVGKLGHTFTMSLRVIDIKSGKISATANVDCKCEIDELLSTSTKQIVRDLLNDLNRNSQEAASSPQTAPTSVSKSPSAGSVNSQKATLDLTASGSKPNSNKKRIGLKIALGAGGLLTLGAGILFDQNAKKYSDNAISAKQAYTSSGTNAGYTTLAASYKTNRDSATQASMYRNVSYIVAGLCGAGLVLTFVF